MLKKLIFSVFFFVLILSFPRLTYAEGEFASAYDISYEVAGSGTTTVSEKITIRNRTENQYIKSFNLKIGSTKISDVKAFDSEGEQLQVEKTDTGTGTQIQVDFTKQVVGIDKEYKWNLVFKSEDFAQKQGRVWQVTIPKITASDGMERFNLSLSVPVSFGDPNSILPEPTSQSESGGRLFYNFKKEQIQESGVIANFGTYQLFDYQLDYDVVNPSILPVIYSLPLPPETAYQDVLVNSIDPKPEDVTIDGDGNFIAWFKLSGKESRSVNVSGIAKIYNTPQSKSVLSPQEISLYTTSKEYWEKDNPIITSKLQEIFKGGTPQTNQEKAKLIYKYVVEKLTYDTRRLENNDFERRGALTALNKPDQVLCSEFTDLFISLTRAAGVPARMLTGFAYTSNQDLRPLSLESDVLHAWPEYYDSDLGWVMVDPTWGNTTGGVDYFSKFDFSHFTLTVRGLSSSEPITAENVDVRFAEVDFEPKSSLELQIDSADEIYAGVTSKLKVKVKNTGNVLYNPKFARLKSSKVSLIDKNFVGNDLDIKISPLPPYGTFEKSLDIKVSSLFDSFDEDFRFDVDKYDAEKKIVVKSFFAFKNYALAAVVAMISMVLFYVLTFLMHLKTNATVLKR